MSTLSSSLSQRSVAEWKQIVEQSRTTKMSLRAFCADKGISLQHLYNWRSRLKAATPRTPRGFKQLRPRSETTLRAHRELPAIVELHLRNGRVLRIASEAVNAQLLQTVIAAAEMNSTC